MTPLTPPAVAAALAALPPSERPQAAARMLLELDDQLATEIPDPQQRLRSLLVLFASVEVD